MSDQLKHEAHDPYDDPKLTAYALGELDEDETKQMEARLREDEPSREALEAIRRTAAALEAEFAQEAAAAMPRRRRFGRVMVGVSFAAAAAVVLMAVGIGLLLPAMSPARRHARVAEPLALATQGNEVDAEGQVESGMSQVQPFELLRGLDGTRNGSNAAVTPSQDAVDIEVLKHSTVASPLSLPTNIYEYMDMGLARNDSKTGVWTDPEGRFTVEARLSTDGTPGATPSSPRSPAPAAMMPGMYPGMMPGMYPGMMPGMMMPGPYYGRGNTNAFELVEDNPFKEVARDPLSTFSVDVDTASYAIIRRFLLQHGQLPPRGAVRIEEMVNYFDYYYPQPEGETPFSVTVDVTDAPWNMGHRLVRIGLKGREIEAVERGAANLVFLIDVSGSMRPADKLPLLRRSLKMLVEALDGDDRIAIVVYAGRAGLVLPSTPVARKDVILAAIDNLEAGGSTNGGQGIELAYRVAAENFIRGGVNRVILATDGDFNVGVTDQGALVGMIEEKRESGVFLSVLGFGLDNLKDSTMEKLANKGNGNYAYIDSIMEGHKVLVRQAGGTLTTIAKDVKIQVEFNPAKVASYRLIGYENRMLAKEDFNDDRKDAGEIGAGHTVTALYEVVPVDGPRERPRVDGLRYQPPPEVTPEVTPEVAPDDDATDDAPFADELLTVKLRYKQPEGEVSQLIEHPVKDRRVPLAEAAADVRFAAAVAGFGMILRDSPHKGDATLERVMDLAIGSLGEDTRGERREFVELVGRAMGLTRGEAAPSRP